MMEYGANGDGNFQNRSLAETFAPVVVLSFEVVFSCLNWSRSENKPHCFSCKPSSLRLRRQVIIYIINVKHLTNAECKHLELLIAKVSSEAKS